MDVLRARQYAPLKGFGITYTSESILLAPPEPEDRPAGFFPEVPSRPSLTIHR